MSKRPRVQALQKVDLSSNLLEALPDCWASFPKLKELYLAHNKLQACLLKP